MADGAVMADAVAAADGGAVPAGVAAKAQHVCVAVARNVLHKAAPMHDGNDADGHGGDIRGADGLSFCTPGGGGDGGPEPRHRYR